jgi:hypothetical protein
MTDLTLSQFKSLSKQDLKRLLKQEELEMHGTCPAHSAAPPTSSLSGRLRRAISSGLPLPLSLQRKLFRNVA